MLLTTLLAAFAIHDGQLVRDAAGEVVEANYTDTWITDADLARVSRHKHLRKLDLSHTKVTDAGLEHLRGLENVRELVCYYAEYLTEDGIAHIAGWKKLEKLNLRGTQVTSKVFERLAKIESLRELDIAFTQIDDEGFEHLALLPRLERLAIGGNRLAGTALPLLEHMPALTHLDAGGIQRVDSGLWGLPLTAQNLARLGRLGRLRWLSLNGATLADRGTDRPGHPEAERSELRDLSALLSLRDLEYLDLSRQPVPEDAVAPLRRLPKLKEIRLNLVRTPSALGSKESWK
jgi:Leucine-rich repeat (LRR) protein